MSLLVEWVDWLTHTWTSLGATFWVVFVVLACLVLAAAGATYQIMTGDGEEVSVAISAIVVGLILSFFWPFVLLAAPFVLAAVSLFFTGMYVVRKLEEKHAAWEDETPSR